MLLRYSVHSYYDPPGHTTTSGWGPMDGVCVRLPVFMYCCDVLMVCVVIPYLFCSPSSPPPPLPYPPHPSRAVHIFHIPQTYLIFQPFKSTLIVTFNLLFHVSPCPRSVRTYGGLYMAIRRASSVLLFSFFASTSGHRVFPERCTLDQSVWPITQLSSIAQWSISFPANTAIIHRSAACYILS